jgi:L-alanine-DL-glutamate epimerase-like enolase superfamily enzyme
MQITSVTPHLVTSPWHDDPWFPKRLYSSAFIEIGTDGGETGLGETTLAFFAPETVPALVDYFAPIVVGRDPMDTTLIAKEMYDDAVWWSRAGAGRSVMSGIEMALWDLKGKILGVPVYELLGGKARDRVPVYASGGPSYWPVDENVRKVAHYADLGYRCAKLSTDFYHEKPEAATGLDRMEPIAMPYAETIDQMAANFESLRAEFGSSFDFAIDGHQGGVPNPIPTSEAVQIADALAPYRIRFYEEPLAYGNLDGYRDLRATSRIPIAGGESLSGLDQFRPLIAEGLHIVQPDVGFAGGIDETIRIIAFAEAHNVGIAIHTGAAIGPALAASWHVAVARRSVDWLETVVASRTAQLDLLGPDFSVDEGTVGLPSRPGLGVDLTDEVLSKYKFVPATGQRY